MREFFRRWLGVEDEAGSNCFTRIEYFTSERNELQNKIFKLEKKVLLLLQFFNLEITDIPSPIIRNKKKEKKHESTNT